jgi:hypothetical protein
MSGTYEDPILVLSDEEEIIALRQLVDDQIQTITVLEETIQPYLQQRIAEEPIPPFAPTPPPTPPDFEVNYPDFQEWIIDLDNDDESLYDFQRTERPEGGGTVINPIPDPEPSPVPELTLALWARFVDGYVSLDELSHGNVPFLFR